MAPENLTCGRQLCGRIWPVWPNAVRIAVGSPDDLAKFRVAFKKVMDAPALAQAAPARTAARGPVGMRGDKFLS